MSIKSKYHCYLHEKAMKMMNSELKHTDYSKYTFEEFLQDEFFISSVKHPTEETQCLWSTFEQSNPDNLDEFKAARDFLRAASTHTIAMPEQETSDLWNRIQLANASLGKVKRRRSYYLIGLSVAASVAILLGSFFALKNNPINHASDIATFAVQSKAELPTAEETLLILSGSKVVSLKEKESNITYDSTAITADREEISKDKSAAYNQLVIPHGKRSVLTFSDGSKVWANAGTRVIYPVEFEKDKREIYVDGEIYIEVTKDENRPFYVRTKDMNVRVLGTKFNVTAYESESVRNVVLAQGSVQVETSSTPKALLSPNQMFTSAGGKENIEQVDVDLYTSWIHGIYSFNSTDLGIILKRLSTYYGKNVEFDIALSKIKCSGKIDLKDNIETVLNGLSFVAPISINYDERNMTYHVVKQ